MEHSVPKLRHLGTRYTLLYEDAELSTPLSDAAAAAFTYPEVQVYFTAPFTGSLLYTDLLLPIWLH